MRFEDNFSVSEIRGFKIQLRCFIIIKCAIYRIIHAKIQGYLMLSVLAIQTNKSSYVFRKQSYSWIETVRLHIVKWNCFTFSKTTYHVTFDIKCRISNIHM